MTPAETLSFVVEAAGWVAAVLVAGAWYVVEEIRAIRQRNRPHCPDKPFCQANRLALEELQHIRIERRLNRKD